MKTILLVIVLTAATVSFGEAFRSGSADEAWAELVSLGIVKRAYPENYEQLSRREKSLWRDRQSQRLRDKGLAFIESHSQDPRRWRVVFGLMTDPPKFITAFGPNIENDFNDFLRDEAAAAAWQKTLTRLEQELRAAEDVPAEVREQLAERDLKRELGLLVRESRRGRVADWTPLLVKLEKFARDNPRSAAPGDVIGSAMYSYGIAHTPEQTVQAWRSFMESTNEPVANAAREKLRFLELARSPLELVFTALDGRQVDLRNLRGKVVLIDFWATWCGPCIEEIPNVKRVYEAYHERGFEVIGISLDEAKDRRKLVDFVAKERLPWAQHFEGRSLKGGTNSLAARFSVTSIPAMLLLDRNGIVVASNVRDAALEREVKRLLEQ